MAILLAELQRYFVVHERSPRGLAPRGMFVLSKQCYFGLFLALPASLLVGTWLAVPGRILVCPLVTLTSVATAQFLQLVRPLQELEVMRSVSKSISRLQQTRFLASLCLSSDDLFARAYHSG